MSTPSSTPSRSRSPAASARAEASGSTGSRSTVPCGVLEASTPAAAEIMPRRFSTIRVVEPVGVVREATTRTVSAVIASSRSAASTKRPSALETIFEVTTRMSPSCSSAPAAVAMTPTRSVPEVISGMPGKGPDLQHPRVVSGRSGPR